MKQLRLVDIICDSVPESLMKDPNPAEFIAQCNCELKYHKARSGFYTPLIMGTDKKDIERGKEMYLEYAATVRKGLALVPSGSLN